MMGTFAMVFAGCGAIMVNELSGGAIGHLGIGLTFGLVVMVMIDATGHISGAHFNPAVTMAFASIGRFPWREVPVYVVAQVVAALCAGLTLRVILGPVADMGMTTPSSGMGPSFALEIILTMFLMFVITAVATDARAVGAGAGLSIGATVALAAIFGGPISGASMNPARSWGPALVAGSFEGQWLYLVAPPIGAIAGAWIYNAIRSDA